MCPRFVYFIKGRLNGKVSQALADYVRQPPDVPEIVFATHQVLPHIKHFANKRDWHLLVDEELQVVQYRQHRLPNTHDILTDHLDVEQVDSVYGQVKVHGSGVMDIARNEDRDELFEAIANTSRILANLHWNSFVNLEQFERLKADEAKVLAIHSVLKPEVLDGFAEVFMTGANFEDSAIFKVWGQQGVEFVPDTEFGKGLRYTNHPNGDRLSIFYATERQWSRKRRESLSADGAITIEQAIIRATKGLFHSGRFLWHANKSVADDLFEPPAKRLPNKPQGLNMFSGLRRHGVLVVA